MTTSSEYDKAIGLAVKQAREMRAWSQATLAAKLSDGDSSPWHQQTILRLESGQRSLKVREMIRLAEVLNVSPLGLLSASIRSTSMGHVDLGRDDIEWMIRDVGQAKGDLETAGEQLSDATQSLDLAIGRIRHHLDVLGTDLVQRKMEELRIFADGEAGTDGTT